jgi:hypothetical protein
MTTVTKDQAIRVQVTDPMARTTKFEYIYDVRPVKSGLLGRIVGTGYNVYRKWGHTSWMTNVTSSTRFNLETDGMTQDEMSIYVKMLDKERAERLAAR